MAELSRDEVIEILGPVGDVIAAEIIATGIGKAELVAAHAYDPEIARRRRRDVDGGPG